MDRPAPSIGQWLLPSGTQRTMLCCMPQAVRTAHNPTGTGGVRLVRTFYAAPTPRPTAAPRLARTGLAPPPHLHQDSACSRTYHCRACIRWRLPVRFAVNNVPGPGAYSSMSSVGKQVGGRPTAAVSGGEPQPKAA